MFKRLWCLMFHKNSHTLFGVQTTKVYEDGYLVQASIRPLSRICDRCGKVHTA